MSLFAGRLKPYVVTVEWSQARLHWRAWVRALRPGRSEKEAKLAADVSILARESIATGCAAVDKLDAIAQVGRKLLETGAVEASYLDAMLERERSLPTFFGEGVATPQGTDESRWFVKRTVLVVLQFPAGVDWDGDDVRLCVGIASKGSEHISILSTLARILMDSQQARRLREAQDADTILQLLNRLALTRR